VLTFSVVSNGVYISDGFAITEPGVKRLRADLSGAGSLRCFLNALCLCDRVLNFVLTGATLAEAFAFDGRKILVVEVAEIVVVLPKFRGQSTLQVHA